MPGNVGRDVSLSCPHPSPLRTQEGGQCGTGSHTHQSRPLPHIHDVHLVVTGYSSTTLHSVLQGTQKEPYGCKAMVRDEECSTHTSPRAPWGATPSRRCQALSMSAASLCSTGIGAVLRTTPCHHDVRATTAYGCLPIRVHMVATTADATGRPATQGKSPYIFRSL